MTEPCKEWLNHGCLNQRIPQVAAEFLDGLIGGDGRRVNHALFDGRGDKFPGDVRHGTEGYEHMEHPNEWWWPTHWRTNVLPGGRWMPVPMPDHEPTGADPHDGPLRIYHIAGKRAFADRNGTDIVIDAMRDLYRY